MYIFVFLLLRWQHNKTTQFCALPTGFFLSLIDFCNSSSNLNSKGFWVGCMEGASLGRGKPRAGGPQPKRGAGWAQGRAGARSHHPRRDRAGYQPLAILEEVMPDSSSAQPSVVAFPAQNCQGLQPRGKQSQLRSHAGFNPSPSRGAGVTHPSSPSLLGPGRAVSAAGISESISPMICKGRQMGTQFQDSLTHVHTVKL